VGGKGEAILYCADTAEIEAMGMQCFFRKVSLRLKWTEKGL